MKGRRISQQTMGQVAQLIPYPEGAVGSTRMIITLAVALFFFLSPPAVSAQDQSSTTDADSAAVKQVFADFYEGFSHHDARATAMTFAEDGDFTNMFGIHIHGRKAIEERFASLFSGGLRAAQRTDTVRTIRFFTPQVAFVDADTVISGTKANDGSDIPLRKGLMIVVMTKQNGRWLISNFHEAEFPVTRAAPVIAPTKNQ
jgi:uncharacterized protein (TIGR02246 family)